MSGTVAIHEKVAVRRALELLAAAHLREATVVDDKGVRSASSATSMASAGSPRHASRVEERADNARMRASCTRANDDGGLARRRPSRIEDLEQT